MPAHYDLTTFQSARTSPAAAPLAAAALAVATLALAAALPLATAASVLLLLLRSLAVAVGLPVALRLLRRRPAPRRHRAAHISARAAEHLEHLGRTLCGLEAQRGFRLAAFELDESELAMGLAQRADRLARRVRPDRLDLEQRRQIGLSTPPLRFVIHRLLLLLPHQIVH